VIPLKGKVPHIKWLDNEKRRAGEFEFRKWLKAWPDMNLGVVTGSISNLVGLDFDGDVAVCESMLAQQGISLPETTRVKTRNGQHLWFQHPGVKVSSTAKILSDGKGTNIDIRGDGGYVVAPPSVHPEGDRYVYLHQVDRLPQMPPALLAFLATAKKSGKADGETA